MPDGVRGVDCPASSAASCYRLRPEFATNEIEVSQIDEQSEPLADDEDRIADIKCVGEQQNASPHREEPECDRDHASTRSLGRHPLHDEAHRKQRLSGVAEQ